jgi:hypothetical protein
MLFDECSITASLVFAWSSIIAVIVARREGLARTRFAFLLVSYVGLQVLLIGHAFVFVVVVAAVCSSVIVAVIIVRVHVSVCSIDVNPVRPEELCVLCGIV